MGPRGRRKVEGGAGVLRLEPGHGCNRVFDVDYFGLDDGQDREPDASMRAIFQLGSGLMIYLYVIGLRQPGEGRWFHTLWIEDCAVAHVDAEELGPPTHVECEELSLPVVFDRVVLEGARPRAFRVTDVTFRASVGADGSQSLRLRFVLARDRIGAGVLFWDDAEGWTLEEASARTRLGAGDRVTFRTDRASG